MAARTSSQKARQISDYPYPLGRYRGARKVAAVALVIAAISYCGWLAGWIFDWQIMANKQAFMSELSALSRPHSGIFRVLDFQAGLSSLVAGFIIWSISRRAVRRRGLALIFFGIFTILDCLFPMSCSPQLEVGCSATLFDLSRPFTDTVHEITSSLAQIAILWALAVTAWDRKELPGRRAVALVGVGINAAVAIAAIIPNAPVGAWQQPAILFWAANLLLWAGQISGPDYRRVQ
ncbi:hypothetical protein BK816_08820 [Boudabousia tangfeifanii]|uniref:DUF998 domain-containing protein n=1 Tax=Boudabousia tangfeifanii TaxID=1912795 RepID=A0A1D9MME2_9ACTO|nr:DUF998 domain-containing protein [Boudabousia tangfeifanii]AOZ73359.1 hypothetical protein BK816_08820 [Boudabousia tangfeifanii]